MTETADFPGPSSVKRYYCVDKREISFLRFVLEGCEGLAVMTTIDPRRGFVVFSIAPGCEKDFDRVLADLKPDILMEPVSPATHPDIYSDRGVDDAD